MKKTEDDAAQVEELLYQALETEIGGIEIYNPGCSARSIRPEEGMEGIPEQTRTHKQVLLGVF
jgi:hypothetical protein